MKYHVWKHSRYSLERNYINRIQEKNFTSSVTNYTYESENYESSQISTSI